MFGFNFGKNIFVGLDIGTSSIKMVELKIVDGKPFLSNYAWMPVYDFLEKYELGSNYFDIALSEYIKRMVKVAGFRGREVYASVPAFGGLITLIELPDMEAGDLEQAIRFEAHKYIPTSLDDVILGWEIVGRKLAKNGNGMNNGEAEGAKEKSGLDAGAQAKLEAEPEAPKERIQVLLVAASKNRVAKHERSIKGAGLKLKNIEIESFSMVTSLVGGDPGNFVIVDMGSRICNIILVEKGIIKANRNIDAGGKDITKTIAKSMGVDEDKAERIKSSGKNFFGQESGLKFPALEIIIGEVSRMINNFYRDGSAKIDAVILSGGTANFTGIEEYFSNALKVKTIVGNPFGRVGYDKKLEPKLIKMGTQFSVCVGLALKGIDEYLKNKK
jgi:type IV pilus assembly protein PilM